MKGITVGVCLLKAAAGWNVAQHATFLQVQAPPLPVSLLTEINRLFHSSQLSHDSCLIYKLLQQNDMSTGMNRRESEVCSQVRTDVIGRSHNQG